ncbi:MAG: GNAT family N-acetyltransferase [Pyrinomonadaceae bacterium]|nr:GNAT family N-acetyltransferase [Pyrinomonadaceae bacterium]
MPLPNTIQQNRMTAVPPTFAITHQALTVERLASGQEREILAFLAERPLHTVIMAGLIRDNGLISPLNRGVFYACRNAANTLEGVALIGHATLFEARTEAVTAAFASLAQRQTRAHMLLGEQEKIAQFWHYYADGGQTTRVVCRELLYEIRWPIEAHPSVRGLRRATLADLDLVMPVQARMAEDESGVNPMKTDAVGFRLRCARRIEQGRTWVLIENGELIFKADVISETPQVIYLEGVFVHAEERGQGYGLRCLSQLSRNLLARARSICLLVNERNKEAQTFYQRAGFQYQCSYETIFLQQVV